MPQLKTFVPAQGTAGTAQDQVIGEASHAATVTEATLIPEAAVADETTAGTGVAHSGYTIEVTYSAQS
jgi:hypothetical protein